MEVLACCLRHVLRVRLHKLTFLFARKLISISSNGTQVFVVTAAGSVIAFIVRDLGESSISGWIIQVGSPSVRSSQTLTSANEDSGTTSHAKCTISSCRPSLRCS